MLYNSKHFYYFLYLKWASDLNPCSIQTDLRVKEMKAFWVFFSGFGSSIGLGVFVLITYVARYVAGPAVVLSALIATATAALSGKFYTYWGHCPLSVKEAECQ